MTHTDDAAPATGATRGANRAAIGPATGHDWEDWAAWLDAQAARDLPDHGAIASLVLGRMTRADAPPVANPEWWAQTVTVAFEQHVGRRVPGQRADGTFDASATRTVAGAVDDVHARAVAAFEERIAAGGGALGGVEAAGPGRPGGSARRRAWRVDLADGSRLALTTEAKAGGVPRALVSVTLSKIADGDAVAGWKALWKEVLAGL